MTVRKALRALLRGEVDAVDHGSAVLDALAEREAERRRESRRLRSVSQEHPDLARAVRERRARLR